MPFPMADPHGMRPVLVDPMSQGTTRFTSAGRQRRVLAVVAGLLWLVNYACAVRRVRLHIGKGSDAPRERLSRIVSLCPSLRMVYWPTFYAPTALLQFMVLGFKEVQARLLQRSPYRREVLTLRDNASIALDWVPAVSQAGIAATTTLPVCVLLHGAFQDSTSVTMSDLARSLSARGMPVVVMNRRGYGGLAADAEVPKLAIHGDDEDLDEVMRVVGRREPTRPVAVVGFSCGSGFAGRYLGNRSQFSAWAADGNQGNERGARRLLCGVMYDPGYDVAPEGAVSRIAWPYSWVLNWGMKYFYAFRHHRVLLNGTPASRQGVLDMLSPKAGAVETYRVARRLSGLYAGVGDSSAWLEATQPRVEALQVPSLLINSRDDPICVWQNVEIFWKSIASNPNIVLAELQRGAHGCKFGFWGFSSIVEDMAGEFILASWRELQESHAKRSDMTVF